MNQYNYKIHNNAIPVKRSAQWLEIMKLVYESLSNSSCNDQEEEEEKVEFIGYSDIIDSEQENSPKTKDILNNKSQ